MTPVAAEWPSLAYDDWRDSCATLHLYTQIVGKIRMAKTPAVNHWWHVPLYLTSRGLTTSPVPDRGRTFEIEFDFIDHELRIATSDGGRSGLALAPRSVADFYAEVIRRLGALGIDARIWTTPCELPDPIPFEQDRQHAAYDAEAVHRFWQVLLRADQALKACRGGFIGKASPVHFFWGSFDLAVTRFSGRPAPVHPGGPNVADSVTREAYSHEVSSCGFWPGDGGFGQPAFYSYAYPEPAGFGQAAIRPGAAYYAAEMGEFVLPYAALVDEPAPEAALLEFLETTYAAAADLGKWDRAALERR